MAVVGKGFTFRLLACLTFLVLAVGVAACGGSDEEDGNDSSQTAQSADEQQIRASLDTMQQALNERDWKTVCSNITKQAKAQFKQAEGHKTCESAVSDVLTDDGSGRNVNEEPETVSVTKIEIDGDQAVVTGTQPGRDGPQQALAVKEGGEWKVNGWFTN